MTALTLILLLANPAGAQEQWCAEAQAGGVVTLAAGTYGGDCALSTPVLLSSTEGAMLTGSLTIDTDGVQVRGLHFKGPSDPAIRVLSGDVQIRGNLFNGGERGIHLAANATGTINDNVVCCTLLDGILIDGSDDADAVVELFGNLLVGTSLQLDGGPARVHNNIVSEGSIRTSAGDKLRNVRIVANTVTSLDLVGWTAGAGMALVGNAIVGPAPEPINGVEMLDNIGCPDPSVCFVDAKKRDFWPTADSPLLAGYSALSPIDGLKEDWCGRLRDKPRHAGALQRAVEHGPGPLSVDFKPVCTGDPPPDAPDPNAVAEPEPSTPQPVADDDSGCSAGGPGRPAAPLLLVLLLVAIRARGSVTESRSAPARVS